MCGIGKDWDLFFVISLVLVLGYVVEFDVS